MFDFNTGARRQVNNTGWANQRRAAEDLVQQTLARHGLAAAGPLPSHADTAGLSDLLRSPLPNGAAQGFKGLRPSVDIPYGAQFLSAQHQGKSGSRDYRLYVPASGSDGVSGIVMMLHGCTQTPEDFAIGTGMNMLAETHGFLVIYPAQSRGANAQTCWNWFSKGDQRAGRGEPEILAGMAQKAMAQYVVPSGRTFVAGLSAGAAMAVILGHSYPDIFAASGAHSGLPYGAASDVPSAFTAMAGNPQTATNAPKRCTRSIVFHGSTDSTVHPSNGEAIARDAERAGPSHTIQSTRHGTAGGLAYSTTVSTDLDGRTHLEHWTIDGLGHAWSGGQPGGSYTDPRGPNASAEMIRFFFETKERSR